MLKYVYNLRENIVNMSKFSDFVFYDFKFVLLNMCKSTHKANKYIFKAFYLY